MRTRLMLLGVAAAVVALVAVVPARRENRPASYLTNLVTFEAAHVPMDEVGSASMGTTETDKLFYPTDLIVVCTEAPGTLGLCTISCGTNATSYNNIAGGSLLTGLTVADKAKRIGIFGAGDTMGAIAGNTNIKCRIGVAASNGGELHVILVGFYGD